MPDACLTRASLPAPALPVPAAALRCADARAAQIRALSELSWFFVTGTSAQLIAIGIVMYQLLTEPDPDAKTELVRRSGHYERQFVAFFNMVFAFGGQFAFQGAQRGGGSAGAWESRRCAAVVALVLHPCLIPATLSLSPLHPPPPALSLRPLNARAFIHHPPAPASSAPNPELMTDMKTPTEFPKAISVCTVIMSSLYASLGAAGYWSKGLGVADIVIFSLGESPAARVAAACILVQAIAQVGRRGGCLVTCWQPPPRPLALCHLPPARVITRCAAEAPTRPAPACAACLLHTTRAQYLVNLNVWTHNLMVLLGRAFKSQRSALARGAAEHAHAPWLGASLFVVAYSWLISMFLPYFSSLVGIVASTTYLVRAAATCTGQPPAARQA